MGVFSNFGPRLRGYCQRVASGLSYRRPVEVRLPSPIISFTFDDFPRSALHVGGRILSERGLRGTYYASLGLMDRQNETGQIFSLSDLREVLDAGHELGCHTFAHCHSWETPGREFEESITRNKERRKELQLDGEFETFSYPISWPSPVNKKRAGLHFACCRGGGQAINSGKTDLSFLRAFFLEKCRDTVPVKEIIRQNSQACGWLIFATHDISEKPTPYGCTPGFFEEVVELAVASGAKILSVVEAWRRVVGEARA